MSKFYPYFGLAGSLVITFCIVITARYYTGKRGEPYTPFNHYISELGEVGVSRLAKLFNMGLVAGGALLLPFIIGLGLGLANGWAYAGMLLGLWSVGSVILVGFNPMNNLKPHIRVALSYFRSGLAMIVLFTVAVFLQPQGQGTIPVYTNLFGLLAVLSYAVFIYFSARKAKGQVDASSFLDPEALPVRPRVWVTAVMEWCVFFSTILWFWCVAGTILLQGV